MSDSIEVDDLVIFTERCTAIGAAKCRANNTPGKVVSIQGSNQCSKRVTYLVDVGSGYFIYAHPDDIKPLKSRTKVENVQ